MITISLDITILTMITVTTINLVSPLYKRSNKSILKEINPEYSLEGLMQKLKLQYIWPPEELTHWKRL